MRYACVKHDNKQHHFQCSSGHCFCRSTSFTDWAQLVKSAGKTHERENYLHRQVLFVARCLQRCGVSSLGPNFISVQSMVNYEVTNNLTRCKVLEGRVPSGSRTLLRLHRALEFILSFMREIHTLQASVPSHTRVRALRQLAFVLLCAFPFQLTLCMQSLKSCQCLPFAPDDPPPAHLLPPCGLCPVKLWKRRHCWYRKIQALTC